MDKRLNLLYKKFGIRNGVHLRYYLRLNESKCGGKSEEMNGGSTSML